MSEPTIGSPTKSVYIIQPYTPAYRVPFFNLLRDELRTRGIALHVIAGTPEGSQLARNDATRIDWVQYGRTRRLAFMGRGLNWIERGYAPSSASLVIVEQAISNLSLWRTLLRRRFRGGPPVAAWGHGRIQTRKSVGLEDKLLWNLTRACDWFFGYTRGSVDDAVDAGYEADRTTTVQNSVDTRQLIELRDKIGPLDDAPPANSILYLGALDAAKGIDLLLAAGRLVAAELPTFKLIVMGDGDLRSRIEAEAVAASWIDYRGPTTEPELKLRAARQSVALILPGRVGLAVVEAFALGLPVIATSYSGNAPEFEYLVHEENSLITGPSDHLLAGAILRMLRSQPDQARLAVGARTAGTEYGLDAMVTNFAEGIDEALTQDLSAMHTTR